MAGDRRDRLCSGGRPSRPGARLRQDPGRLQLRLQPLRDPTRPPWIAEPLGGRRARRSAATRRPGAQEVVLTGINLGCYRDRAAGFPRRAWYARSARSPGLERLRLSSIEINHVDGELVSALRETPNVADLRVPLQSGETACSRTWHVATPPPRTSAGWSPSRDFNLTTDAIVGFPTEDERAFLNTLSVIEERPTYETPRLSRTRRDPERVTAGNDAVAPDVKKTQKCAAARGVASGHVWRAGVRRSAQMVSLPWFRSAQAAATGTTTRRGSSRHLSASLSGFAVRPFGRRGSSLPRGLPLLQARARGRPRCEGRRLRRRSATSTRGRDTHLLVLPERHVPTRSARSASSRPTRRSGCSTSSPRPRATPASRTTASLVNVGEGARADDLPPRSPSARSREGNHVSLTSSLL